MNPKSIATHGLAFLIGCVVASFLAFNLASAGLQRQREISASISTLDKQVNERIVNQAAEYLAARDHCEDAVKKFYGTETILYEAAPPKISVFHGAVNISPGDAVQFTPQLKPKWLIGARVTPVLAPGMAAGAAYGYMDKNTGAITGPFQPAAQ